jgi:hypothetical protein
VWNTSRQKLYFFFLSHLAAWERKKTRQKATPKARDEIKITHNLDKSRRYIRLGLKFVKKNPTLDGSSVLREGDGLGHIDWDRVQIDVGIERIATVGQRSVIRITQNCVDIVNLAESLKKGDQVQ